MKIAAMADVHVKEYTGMYRGMFERISDEAEVLLLGGDLTHNGFPEEARALARELEGCSVPVLAVLGNHDCEQGRQDEICGILKEAGVEMIDGAAHRVNGVGFAGAKGFGGGFDNRMLLPWGESMTKQFVYESVNEASKLDHALSSLECEAKVALLHYAPIRATVVGESSEIYTFLGCSRLVDPIDRAEVKAVFHGHAHLGTHEGRTPRGIPVYNVSVPVMRELSPERPYLVLEV